MSNFRLLIASSSSSESLSFTETLAQELSKRINAEILVANFSRREMSLKNVQNCNVVDFQFDLNDYISDKSNFDKAGLKINDLIKEFNPNIVQLNNPLLNNFNIDVPVVITAHQDEMDKLRLFCKRNVNGHNILSEFISQMSESYKKASAVTAPSRCLAEKIYKNYGVSKNLKVINNGIIHTPKNEVSEQTNLITDLNGQTDNLFLLSKVASKLPGGINLYAVGKRPQDRSFSSNVRFISNFSKEESQNVFNKCSLYLGLSTWDTSGLFAMKSAYENCAIVANDVALNRELWGDCACFFEKNDVNSLLRNINNLVENQRYLDRVARSCQAKAVSAFNSRKMCFEYINLYKYLLSKKSAI